MPPCKYFFKQKKRMLFFLIAVFLAAFIAGCMNTEIGNPESSSVYSFNSDSELGEYLRDQHSQTIDSFSENAGGDNLKPPSDENYSPVYVDKDSNGESVHDPGDIMQSTGAYTYAAGNRRVTIARTDGGGETETVSVIYTDGTAKALHLLQDRLVIFYTFDAQDDESSGENINGVTAGMLIVDVSQPEHPETIYDYKVEGAYQVSFTTDDRLYVIQHFLPDLPLFRSDYDSADPALLADRSQAVLEDFSFEDLVPFYSVFGKDDNHIFTGMLVDADRIYQPKEPTGGKLTTVTAFDLNNLYPKADVIAFTGNVQSIRISPTAVYLTDDSPAGSSDDPPVYEIDISGFTMCFSACSQSV